MKRTRVRRNFHDTKYQENILNHLCFEYILELYQFPLKPLSEGLERLPIAQMKGCCILRNFPGQPNIHETKNCLKKSSLRNYEIKRRSDVLQHYWSRSNALYTKTVFHLIQSSLKLIRYALFISSSEFIKWISFAHQLEMIETWCRGVSTALNLLNLRHITRYVVSHSSLWFHLLYCAIDIKITFSEMNRSCGPSWSW